MVFRVPKIKSCCYCASLGTGSKIIGGLHALLVIAIMILIFIDFHPSRLSLLQAMIYDSVFLDVAVTSFLMIYGIYKEIYHLIFPWILMEVVLLLFIVIYFVSDVTFFALMDAKDLGIAIELITITIVSYSIMVVYNFYRDLKERSANEVGQSS